jgi:hypothetical protein
MRTLLLFLLVLMTLPALAQGWDRYDNTRFGYFIDLPFGFVAQGESAYGDGQSFAMPGKPIDLSVWGGLIGADFEQEVARRIAQDGAGGWSVTYQAVTPGWASWSSIKGDRIAYERLITLCDGSSYAAFRAEYSSRDRPLMDPIVEQIAGSLKGSAC